MKSGTYIGEHHAAGELGLTVDGEALVIAVAELGAPFRISWITCPGLDNPHEDSGFTEAPAPSSHGKAPTRLPPDEGLRRRQTAV